MQVQIVGRNVDIDAQLEIRISRKMNEVARHLPAITSIHVELTAEPTRSRQERFLAQISLNIKGAFLRSEQRGPSALAAVHAASQRLDQLASRFKGQVYRSQRSHSYISVAEQQAADAFEADRELAREYLPESEAELVATE